MMTTSEISLQEEYVTDTVDHRGFAAKRSNTGRWRAALFIIGVEVAERFAYYGIGSNLISYLTGPLGQSTAVAAANVNAWSGVATLLPALGAFVADAFLGRYRTIIIASLIYVLGLAFLTLSAFLIPISCSENSTEVISSPSSLLNALFFFSLYLVAIGQSGHKPYSQEISDRSSFFNWWYLSLSAGICLAILVVVYIQEEFSWAFGFGIPCLFMVISLVLFVLGRRSYRYSKRRDEEEINPFTRIGRVFFVAFKNQRLSSSELCKVELEANTSPEKQRFFNKALLVPNDSSQGENACKSCDVEDATALIRLIPVWLTTLAYTIPYAQYMTFFTKQGVTMDRTILPGVKIPPASLQVFIGVSIVLFVPIYDRVFVPIARSITKDPCGITTLKRIGTGIVLSIITMVIAALVESKRLETAKVIDQPGATVPMSIWWLIPQYLLLGLADVYTLVGMQEFFYSQVPTELRSIGLALYLSALGLGSLLSSLLISLIDLATGGDAGNSWFNSNLNRAHLDYFYWLLARKMTTASDIYLQEEYVTDAVDHRGFAAKRSNTGRWRAALFIIGVEVAERFAYYGIGSNLISYLTGPLGQSTAVAAANVNAWSGIATLLPVLGAFVADAFLGRYRTIIIATLIYVLGLAFLTLSAFLIPNTTEVTSTPSFLNALFFFSLYLVAIGQSGHKPCVQAFGADQFDEKNQQENTDRSSFFNWWYLSMCAGIALAILVVVYIQENVSWAVGFGIPCVFMVISLVLFVLGRRSYRYSKRRQEEEINPFTRIGRVFFVAFKNQRLSSSELYKVELEANPSQESPEELSFLNKALLVPNDSPEGEMACKSRDVDDATTLVRLIPVWLTTLAYAIPYAQYMTFFTKQGVTMERTIFPGLEIPPASLQALISITIVLFVPIYDRVLVPIGRSITKDPCGITTLKRIGTGMVLATLTMVVAALVESKRLQTAKEYGLIDQPKTTLPMSILWLFPQYILLGLADVHTLVGMQEFFYSQVPTELRSIGLALYLSALGVGSLINSLLISLIDLATGGDAGNSWFNSNLNKAHLDYFYWLVAVVSAVGFFTFLFISRSYIYRRVD
ncbi:proton-dependent oligopeptide transport family protein [Arabidopsis lyrata subsp. lyrata]|uniref:Proton-dependent oligopeptide transport family protein n=2 Tax=Arabidopsis lyrata subsp. lyrata TaxID=81972 RepID=D7KZ97_ARALL|nr:proton-dependent oligopeptide transport family protein [Arabidopsis lyrata subsp. lyrata]